MIAKRIRISFEGEMLTFVEVAARVGLSPSRVATLHYQGRVIEKSSRMQARRIEFDGRMLTAHEIAPLVGLTASTVRHRMSLGRPVVPIKRQCETFEYNGEKRTIREIAEAIGKGTEFVRYRLTHGIPLDGPGKPGRKRKDPLAESGEHRLGEPRGVGENGLYWEDDIDAKLWHQWIGGDDFGELTLEEIGDLWDISRERVRQIERNAVAKIKARADRGDKDALALVELLQERSELRARRAPSTWEQAEMNSPGSVDLAEWERTHSMSELAKRSGRGNDVDASLVASAKRGNAAAVRTRMERRTA